MESIRVQNLRSLADTGGVELRPLTLLVGRNSSGKSTFLRAFPLLRQSVEVRTKGPLLWYGPYVDFGSFGDALRTGAEPPEIVFSFLLKLGPTRFYPWWGPGRALLGAMDLEVALHLAQTTESRRGERLENTYTREMRLTLNSEDHLVIRLDRHGAVESLKVNGTEFSDGQRRELTTRQGHLLPYLVKHASLRRRDRGQALYVDEVPLFYEELLGELGSLFHGRTQKKTVVGIAQRLGLGTAERMHQDLASLPESLTGKYFQRHLREVSLKSEKFRRIRALLLASSLPELLKECDSELSNFARGVTYVAPVRASAERYYRAQDLAVDELDFQGKNLAMFLHSLGTRRLRDFAEWTKGELGFVVTTDAAGGHISVRMQEVGSRRKYNLADMGFGFSQVLPVAAQLWLLASGGRSPRRRTRLFGIEQPELHLHPTYQSQLADFMMNTLVAAKKSRQDVRLLVETHSPVIVNTIGERVAEGRFDRSDVHIVLFERLPEEDATRVKLVEFDSDGFLTNWPYGFFEAEAR